MFRGYKIKTIEGVTYFEDNGLPTSATWGKRPCGHCGLFNTKEGHDGCLGTLPNVMNACCGHGVENDAYIQNLDGSCVRGKQAIKLIDELKNGKQKEKLS